MDAGTLRASLDANAPPAGLPPLVRALWLEGHGDWDGAHAVCNEVDGPDGAWVHAYLHRREGDLSNADYWYRRAGRERPPVDLDAEWEAIADELLARAQE